MQKKILNVKKDLLTYIINCSINKIDNDDFNNI